MRSAVWVHFCSEREAVSRRKEPHHGACCPWHMDLCLMMGF